MYFIYILESQISGILYKGYTKNIKLRLKQHNNKLSLFDKRHAPFKLIYYEACLNQKDALKREKYFKTHYGIMFLKRRLQSYFTPSGSYPIKK